MAGRINRLPQNTLVSDLVRLEEDSNGLKALQRVGGTNVQGYLFSTPGSYYASYTIAANSRQSKYIAFVQPNAVYTPLTQLFLFYSLNQDVLNNAIPPYANGPVVSMQMQDMVYQGQVNRWYATFTNNTSTSQTIYVRPVFNGTSLGLVSIADVLV